MTLGKAAAAALIVAYTGAAWLVSGAAWWRVAGAYPDPLRVGLLAVPALLASAVAAWFTLFFAAIGGLSWTR